MSGGGARPWGGGRCLSRRSSGTSSLHWLLGSPVEPAIACGVVSGVKSVPLAERGKLAPLDAFGGLSGYGLGLHDQPVPVTEFAALAVFGRAAPGIVGCAHVLGVAPAVLDRILDRLPRPDAPLAWTSASTPGIPASAPPSTGIAPDTTTPVAITSSHIQTPSTIKKGLPRRCSPKQTLGGRYRSLPGLLARPAFRSMASISITPSAVEWRLKLELPTLHLRIKRAQTRACESLPSTIRMLAFVARRRTSSRAAYSAEPMYPLCRIEAVELQGNEALRHSVALNCLSAAGPNEDSSTMRSDGRRDLPGELGVRLGVDDFSVHDEAAPHPLIPFDVRLHTPSACSLG